MGRTTRRHLGGGSYIVSDDADKYLKSLPPEKRVEEPGMGGLPKTGRSFTPAEVEAAFAIFCPPKS